MIGVVFLGFGVHGLRRARVLRSAGVTVEARIVRHDVRRYDEGVTLYHPVAAWTTPDGRPCEYSSRFGRGSVRQADCFRTGTLVSVRYDPADPRRFVIEGWDSTGVDRLFTVVGTVLMAGTPAVLLVLLLAL